MQANLRNARWIFDLLPWQHSFSTASKSDLAVLSCIVREIGQNAPHHSSILGWDTGSALAEAANLRWCLRARNSVSETTFLKRPVRVMSSNTSAALWDKIAYESLLSNGNCTNKPTLVPNSGSGHMPYCTR